jgi:hypothetical protein
MNTTTFRPGVTALARGITRTTRLLLTLLLGAGACTAQASNDASYKLYRCTVLGDSSACAAAPRSPAVRVEERLVPGPYARYLIYLGHSQSDALASAGRIGEFPVRRVVRITERQLTDLEKYERYLGRDVAPATTEETLSVELLQPAGSGQRAGQLCVFCGE